MSTASNHSPTELNEGKEGSVRSASDTDEPRVLDKHRKRFPSSEWKTNTYWKVEKGWFAWRWEPWEALQYLRPRVEDPMLSGLLMVLLRALWIWVKVGLSVLSFCQQSSMSWCRDGGQFTGAGNRNPSSIAFITCNVNIRKFKHKNIIIEYWLFGVMEYIVYWPINNAESYIVKCIYFKIFKPSRFLLISSLKTDFKCELRLLNPIVYTSHWSIFNFSRKISV